MAVSVERLDRKPVFHVVKDDDVFLVLPVSHMGRCDLPDGPTRTLATWLVACTTSGRPRNFRLMCDQHLSRFFCAPIASGLRSPRLILACYNFNALAGLDDYICDVCGAHEPEHLILAPDWNDSWYWCGRCDLLSEGARGYVNRVIPSNL